MSTHGLWSSLTSSSQMKRLESTFQPIFYTNKGAPKNYLAEKVRQIVFEGLLNQVHGRLCQSLKRLIHLFFGCLVCLSRFNDTTYNNGLVGLTYQPICIKLMNNNQTTWLQAPCHQAGKTCAKIKQNILLCPQKKFLIEFRSLLDQWWLAWKFFMTGRRRVKW